MKSVCPEPNSNLVITNCKRLFSRNRQAINVNTAALRQLPTAPDAKSHNSDCPRPFPYSRVTRASRVFVDDWISGVADPATPRPVTLNSPVEQPESVKNADTFDDFMEAFHGLESVSHRQIPYRVRHSSRRSQSAETRGVFQSQESPARSHLVCSRDARVTRSKRRCGINR